MCFNSRVSLASFIAISLTLLSVDHRVHAASTTTRALTPTHYISVSGNDSTGTGASNAPWRTLLKACQSVNVFGSVIQVTAGVYVETEQCRLAVGVSIQGDGPTSVLQSTITRDFTPLIYAGSPEGTNGAQSISNLKLDGRNLTGNSAVWIAGRSNVSIHDTEVVDFFDNGIIFSGRQDGNAMPPSTAYATGNTFYNNKVINCARYDGYGRGNLMIGGQRDMLIYNNTLVQDSRPSGQNGWPIKYFNDGYLQGVKIYSNTVTKNVLFGTGEDFSFAFEIFNAQGVEIFNNTVQGSLDFNFQGNKGAYPFTVHVHNNLVRVPAITDRVQEAVIFEFDTDSAIVENNHFDKLTQGVVFYARPGTVLTNITIRNNLVTDLGNSNGQAYFVGGFGAASAPFPTSNLKIFNNTVISSADPALKGDFAMGFTGMPGFSFDRVQVKNNIIAGFKIGPVLIQDRSRITNSSFEYNDFFNNGDDTRLIPPWASTGIPFPASTTEANNLVTVNPSFIGGGNYMLQSSSALVNAGTNVGLPFNGSAPDIGYAETSLGCAAPLAGGSTCNLDVDGNGRIEAAKDGVLIVRRLLGFSGAPLTANAIDSCATRTSATSPNIESFIDAQALDVDTSGGTSARSATSDGLLILRAMLGLTGTAVTNGLTTRAWDTGANNIKGYLNANCGMALP
jgi:hypothetical protein